MKILRRLFRFVLAFCALFCALTLAFVVGVAAVIAMAKLAGTGPAFDIIVWTTIAAVVAIAAWKATK